MNREAFVEGRGRTHTGKTKQHHKRGGMGTAFIPHQTKCQYVKMSRKGENRTLMRTEVPEDKKLILYGTYINHNFNIFVWLGMRGRSNNVLFVDIMVSLLLSLIASSFHP